MPTSTSMARWASHTSEGRYPACTPLPSSGHRVRSQRCSAADRIYGVTCIQTFHYFRSQQAKADAWYLRNIVSPILLSQSLASLLTTGEPEPRLGPFCNSESLSSFFDTPSHSSPPQVPGHGSPSYHHSSSLLLWYNELRQSLRASEGFMVRLSIHLCGVGIDLTIDFIRSIPVCSSSTLYLFFIDAIRDTDRGHN